ncbi:MAG: hypothetical protein Q8S84_07295 [bacterium]|nr:hypothetical protein [bacterium]MDP3381257.1 hypothetical protein [bacterium]
MIFINAIHISINANMKYTTFETSIHISLKYTFNQNKLPFIQVGDKNIVAKYVINANNKLIHFKKNSAIVEVLSINESTLLSAANEISVKLKNIIKNMKYNIIFLLFSFILCINFIKFIIFCL